MVRTFLAIDLPDSLKADIAEAVAHWKGFKAGVRWVDPARMHLTLRFFGDLEESSISAVSAACREVAVSCSPISMKLLATGVFPALRRPRVLWIGVGSEEREALFGLRDRLETRLAQEGFQRDEKRFSPHVTVGRVKTGRNMARLMDDFMRYEPAGEGFTVKSMVLYSSTLTPQGPVYRQIEEFEFSHS